SKRPVEIEARISKIFNMLSEKLLDIKLIEEEISRLKIVLSADDPLFVRLNAIIERKKLLEV
ncbi:MAG TPA: hypothetical protein PKD85_17200, partial [Saprospiraceae bacterium]|nr:hypothetical protein [Saprospiraceae bacterium]